MTICFATTALRVSLSYKRSSIAKQKSADFDKRASRSKRTTCQLRTHTLVTLCAIPLIVPALSANEPASTFCDWHHRGMVLLHAGNYPAAAQAFRQALALAKTSTSAVPDLIAIHTSLASAYTLEGRYVESRDEFHDALVLVEKGQGAHSLDYALIFASMALLPDRLRHPIESHRSSAESNRRERQPGIAKRLGSGSRLLSEGLVE